MSEHEKLLLACCAYWIAHQDALLAFARSSLKEDRAKAYAAIIQSKRASVHALRCIDRIEIELDYLYRTGKAE